MRYGSSRTVPGILAMVIVWASAAAGTSAVAAETPAGPSQTATPPWARTQMVALTPQDLAGTVTTLGDVQGRVPDPDLWWPRFPEFYVVGYGVAAETEPAGELFYVVQAFERVDSQRPGRIESTLILFEDEDTARAGFAELSSERDAGGTSIDGPPVGDAWRYFTRGESSDLAEATLRFQTGTTVGRVSVFGVTDASAELLAAHASLVVDRIAGLLSGMPVATLNPDLVSLLPPDHVDGIGPNLGTAIAPTKSWALLDLEHDPIQVESKLRDLGATELAIRRYGLLEDSGHVLEVVLFPFADEDASSAWLQDFRDQAAGYVSLDPGRTGRLGTFGLQIPSAEAAAESWGDNYELQFAVGRFAADVSCFALFDERASPSCETPVRRLAEAWFSALSGR